jgi:hypothetical protein
MKALFPTAATPKDTLEPTTAFSLQQLPATARV